jgi:transposase-like protein
VGKLNLRGVKVLRGCTKPNCQTGSYTLNRHHKKHEAMWRGIWAARRRGEPAWEAFLKRYHEYRAEDIVLICVSHHAEIHAIYDQIIRQHIQLVGKSLAKFSWTEARALMAELEKTCMKWLREETPGISSKKYGSFKERSKRRKDLQARIKQVEDEV